MLRKTSVWIAFIGMLIIIGMLSLYLEKRKTADVEDGRTDIISASKTENKITSPKVGIQIGHWKTDELPDELWKLHWNYGAAYSNYTELGINTTIANLVARYLQDENITVDLLPATISQGYKADAFVSIHTDGNDDNSVSGYKVTWSEFDASGKSKTLSDSIETAYAAATKLSADPNISSDMTEYFAFNYNKYTHSISSSTAAAIIETGFITNSSDRSVIAKQPEKCARAIANGIIEFLRADRVL